MIAARRPCSSSGTSIACRDREPPNPRSLPMNAIELLKSQHREVEELFSEIQNADDASEKEELFTKLADSLAIHARIEEHQFYPGVKAQQTEDILLEAVEE